MTQEKDKLSKQVKKYEETSGKTSTDGVVRRSQSQPTTAGGGGKGTPEKGGKIKGCSSVQGALVRRSVVSGEVSQVEYFFTGIWIIVMPATSTLHTFSILKQLYIRACHCEDPKFYYQNLYYFYIKMANFKSETCIFRIFQRFRAKLIFTPRLTLGNLYGTP